MGKRIDLHTHSIFSDGELLPSEIARRACLAMKQLLLQITWMLAILIVLVESLIGFRHKR